MDASFLTSGPSGSFFTVYWIKMYFRAIELPDAEAAAALPMPLPTYAAIVRNPAKEDRQPLTMFNGYTPQRGDLMLRYAEQSYAVTSSLGVPASEWLAFEFEPGMTFRAALKADTLVLERAVNKLSPALVAQMLMTFEGSYMRLDEER